MPLTQRFTLADLFRGPQAPPQGPSAEPYVPKPVPSWKQKIQEAIESGFDVFGGALGLPGTPASKSRTMGELLNFALPVVAAAKSIKAFHGSPHDFDKFSLDKIGTGEGAQAYGHGLYFAEKEGTARAYRDQLSPVDINTRADGAPISHDLQRMIGDAWQTLHGRTQTKPTIQAALDDVDDALMRQRADAMKARDLEWFNKIEDQRLEVQRVRQSAPEQKGRMYEVNINADPDDFLDWDAPLSQQPKVAERLGVSQAVQLQKRLDELVALKDAKAADRMPNNVMRDEKGWHALSKEADAVQAELKRIGSGADLWNDTRLKAQPEFVDNKTWAQAAPAASEMLKAKGIPGIKYFDQGSRSSGQGTRNYVVFDDKLISIVKKYGIAGALTAGLINESQARQLQAQQQPMTLGDLLKP